MINHTTKQKDNTGIYSLSALDKINIDLTNFYFFFWQRVKNYQESTDILFV